MKVYLNKEYKCVKVEDNTFVANDSSNYIRYYFVTNANGDVIDKMDDTSVIYRNTEPSYVTVAFRRADGDVIQHLMASPKTDTTGKSFFEYEITNTDGVLYKKGALEISAQFIEATLSETGGVKKVISQKVKAIAINTAHVLDNIGEEAEEYYSQYEQANNDAHAVLQTQITTNFNNIGTLQELTTDAKEDLVKAINEVDAHADANKSEIGDLSTLTTDEKTTIVGAINEVDQHADNAQQTADNAKELANTGISKAEQAQATANNAVATANEAKTTAQTAETNANSAVDKANDAVGKANEAIMKADAKATSIGFMTAKDAVTALNGYPRNQLKGGDTIWIVEAGTPDLWVTEVAQESVPYNYTTKDKFNQDLVDNKVLQIGYFKTAYQESDGKPVTIAWQNVVVKNWVASTEFADFPYEAKIELTDFVDYTTIPQVVFDIADTMSGNYAPICKSGDKCVYIYSKVQNEITLKTVITFAPNVNGASVTGGGYNNRGKWVASTTYAIDDLVYTDNGQYVCIEGITSTTSPEQDTTHWQATFVATGKTKNGLKFSGQNGNGTEVQKTFDGSQAVEVAFDENTMTAKEVNGVLEIGAKGTIPEALPQTAEALKSGNLPTSGWTDANGFFFDGEMTLTNTYQKMMTLSLEDYNLIINNWNTTYIKITQNETEHYTFGIYSRQEENDVYNLGFGDVAESVRMKINKTTQEVFVAKPSTSYTRVINKFYNTLKTVKLYTISDTSITANSDVLMELTDNGGVKAYSMEAGKITVIRDTVPTQPIPYTYKVKQTNASGQFTLVNHFVPEVPESPTSLPVTYKKVSGNLPTSGWTNIGYKTLYDGYVKSVSGTNIYNNGTLLSPSNYSDNTTLSAWAGTMFYWYTTGYEVQKVEKTTQNGVQGVKLSFNNSNYFIYVMDNGQLLSQKTNATLLDENCKLIIKATFEQSLTYTISDTFITANTSVKMYLTDAGGVKAHSKASGSITVIRDTVPTTAIPYEYEVEQTSVEGLFEVINAYVPDVPTKTSELTNDSGFVKASEANTFTAEQTFSNANGIKTNRVHNLNGNAWYDFDGTNDRFGSLATPTIIRTSEARPKAEVPSGSATATKEIALLEDIKSVGEWQNWSNTSTLTEEGLYEIVTLEDASSGTTFFVQYEQGKQNDGACFVTANASAVTVITPACSADGKLSVTLSTSTSTTTEPVAFKYRKIN